MKPKAEVRHHDRQISAAVKRAREAAGIELETCAGLAGMSVSTLRKQESGDARISTKQLFKLAKICRVSMTSFFEKIETPR